MSFYSKLIVVNLVIIDVASLCRRQPTYFPDSLPKPDKYYIISPISHVFTLIRLHLVKDYGSP
jgi:hypothetical protein